MIRPAAVLAAVLVAGGCSSSGGHQAALSKSAYVKQADAECASALAKAKQLHRPQLTQYAALSRYARTSLSIVDGFQREERALAGRSSDEKELLEKWLDPAKAQFDRTRPTLDALVAANGDKAKVKAAVRHAQQVADSGKDDNDTTKITKFLRSYGLPTCAAFESY